MTCEKPLKVGNVQAEEKFVFTFCSILWMKLMFFFGLNWKQNVVIFFFSVDLTAGCCVGSKKTISTAGVLFSQSFDRKKFDRLAVFFL